MTAASATIVMPARTHRGLPRSVHSLPLRVRLVAVVLVLLFTALTLTGLTTIFLMKRSLMTAVDRDLAQAAVPTASQALDQLRSNRPGTLPTSYAVRFMPANGDAVIFGPPSTAERRQHPDIPRLAINDPRVRTHEPFTVGSTDEGGGRWRVIAGATDANIATYAVAVSLDNVDTSVRRHARLGHPDRHGRDGRLRGHRLVRRAPRLPAAHPDRGHRRGHRRGRPHPAHPRAHRPGRGQQPVDLAERHAGPDRAVVRRP